MIEIYINSLPIILGGLTAIIIGFIWYSPLMFGKKWMEFARITPENIEESKSKMLIKAFLGLLVALSMVFVINWFYTILGDTTIKESIFFGFLIWVGFIVPPLLSSVLWENKKFGYFAINAGYWLVTVVSMSIIVGF